MYPDAFADLAPVDHTLSLCLQKGLSKRLDLFVNNPQGEVISPVDALPPPLNVLLGDVLSKALCFSPRSFCGGASEEGTTPSL
jgi:hypothetical protein